MAPLRVVLLLLALLAVPPAWAQSWESYANARFGYAIAVPPGFLGVGEAANGDGQRFRSRDGTQSLAVWGGHSLDGGFEPNVATALRAAADSGWTLSYERVTPRWASWSGSRNGIVLYTRHIALCDGARYAAFELTYPQRDLARMDAVVERLVGSLRGSGDC
jgi:hypothetical protein